MLVGKRMTKDPVTVSPDDYLSTAQEKMREGNFRRLPIVKDGRLVGIVTDRDLREHAGFLPKTKVNAAMKEDPITVKPETTLEEAAMIMLKKKIGGLPVVDKGKLIGIVTISDVLEAFLDVIGASNEGTSRIDLLIDGQGSDLTGASKITSEAGGQILGVGTYREKWGESQICYLRVCGRDPELLAERLKEKGFIVLGIYDRGTSS